MDIFKLVSAACLCLVLNACQLWQKTDSEHYARCQEIKSRITFTGITPNPHLRFKEQSEKAKLSEAYQQEKCD